MQERREGPIAKGWRPVTDPSSGETYYWNPTTDEVTWKRPAPPRDPVGDASLTRGFSWLDDWMARESLELDVPWPAGVDASAGTGALIEHAWRCSTDVDRTLVAYRADGVACKSLRVDGVPVASTEWAVDAPGVTLRQFLDFKLEAASPGDWDPDFIGAELLDAFGSADRIGQPFAQLVRWRSRAVPPLFQRERLYVMVPSMRDDQSAAILVYLSVRSARYPVLAGHSRARCLAPSYDLATCLPGGGLRLRRLSTAVVGGCVPSCVDALLQPAGLAAAAQEGRRVRNALCPPEPGAGQRFDGGASLVEWARDVQWELDREREVQQAPPKERGGLAYSPELWVRHHTKAAAPPPPPALAEPVHPTSMAVGPDALELGWAKQYGAKDLKNKSRNKFALMQSERESKVSAKMQNVGHNGTDSWEMEAAIKAKLQTQGAKQTRYGGPMTGVKATVTKEDYMINESLKYQGHVRDVKTPDKSLYQGVAGKIPVDSYLLEDQRNATAILRATKVEGDQYTSLPAPKYGPDSFLAEAYRRATGIVSEAQTGIEEATIVRSPSPGVKTRSAISGLGRTLFSSTTAARPQPDDGPLYAPATPATPAPPLSPDALASPVDEGTAAAADAPPPAAPADAPPADVSAADAEMSA